MCTTIQNNAHNYKSMSTIAKQCKTNIHSIKRGFIDTYTWYMFCADSIDIYQNTATSALDYGTVSKDKFCTPESTEYSGDLLHFFLGQGVAFQLLVEILRGRANSTCKLRLTNSGIG